MGFGTEMLADVCILEESEEEPEKKHLLKKVG